MTKRTSVRDRLGADALFSQPTAPAEHAAAPPSLVKITVYVEQAQVLKLERLRLVRLVRGAKTDKSSLVREALDLLPDPGAGA